MSVRDKLTKSLQDEVRVNDKPLWMELDTGAAVSIVSEYQLKVLHPSISLQPSEVLLQTYMGERITVVGEVNILVQHNQQ